MPAVVVQMHLELTCPARECLIDHPCLIGHARQGRLRFDRNVGVDPIQRGEADAAAHDAELARVHVILPPYVERSQDQVPKSFVSEGELSVHELDFRIEIPVPKIARDLDHDVVKERGRHVRLLAGPAQIHRQLTPGQHRRGHACDARHFLSLGIAPVPHQKVAAETEQVGLPIRGGELGRVKLKFVVAPTPPLRGLPVAGTAQAAPPSLAAEDPGHIDPVLVERGVHFEPVHHLIPSRDAEDPFHELQRPFDDRP